MTVPPAGRDPTAANGEEQTEDLYDLKRIRGIGTVKQQWFRELLGILTLEDLAIAEVEVIETRFRDEGHLVSRSEIEGWIHQAQELVSELSVQIPASSTEISEVTEIASSKIPILETKVDPQIDPPVDPQVKVETEAEVAVQTETKVNLQVETEAKPETPFILRPDPVEMQLIEAVVPIPLEDVTGEGIVDQETPAEPDTGWETFAYFTVEFQTKLGEDLIEQRTLAHHQETGVDKSWGGIEGEALQRWLMNRVVEALQPKGEVGEGMVQPPVGVEITQVKLFQPPWFRIPMVINRTGQVFSTPIRQCEPFALEISFHLTEAAIADIPAAQITYQLQCYARDRATGNVISLDDATPKLIIPGQTIYTLSFPETKLQAGTYRLQILIILQGILVLPAFLEIPLLQVL